MTTIDAHEPDIEPAGTGWRPVCSCGFRAFITHDTEDGALRAARNHAAASAPRPDGRYSVELDGDAVAVRCAQHPAEPLARFPGGLSPAAWTGARPSCPTWYESTTGGSTRTTAMADLLGEIRARDEAAVPLCTYRAPDGSVSATFSAEQQDRRTLLRLLDTAREELADALGRIDRVRSIHNHAECGNARCKLGGWCIGCDPNGDSGCDEHPWPCPTVLTLEPDAKLPDQYAAWVLKRDHDAVKAELERLRAENRLLNALRDRPAGQCGRVRPHAPHRWLPNRVALDCPGIPAPGAARDNDGENDDG